MITLQSTSAHSTRENDHYKTVYKPINQTLFHISLSSSFINAFYTLQRCTVRNRPSVLVAIMLECFFRMFKHFGCGSSGLQGFEKIQLTNTTSQLPCQKHSESFINLIFFFCEKKKYQLNCLLVDLVILQNLHYLNKRKHTSTGRL